MHSGGSGAKPGGQHEEVRVECRDSDLDLSSVAMENHAGSEERNCCSYRRMTTGSCHVGLKNGV